MKLTFDAIVRVLVGACLLMGMILTFVIRAPMDSGRLGAMRWIVLGLTAFAFLVLLIGPNRIRGWLGMPAPRPLTKQERWMLTVLIAVLMPVVFIANYLGSSWLSSAACVVVPLFFAFRNEEGRFQFSLSKLFGIVTVLALLIAGMTLINRWHARATYELHLKAYQASLTIWEEAGARLETNRPRLSPQFYDSQRKYIDQKIGELEKPVAPDGP